jgi:uncharacterized membrane protein
MATTVTEKSSTGLDANLAGALAYALGWVTGIVFLVIEKDSRFVKFHAVQSIAVFLGFTVIWFVLASLPIFWFVALMLSPFVALAAFILWILLMVKAYNGEKFKLPFVGDIAEQQSNK